MVLCYSHSLNPELKSFDLSLTRLWVSHLKEIEWPRKLPS